MARKPANTDNQIRKLTDGQHIRLRTEMYLGSRSPHTQTVVNWDGNQLTASEQTWVPAVLNAFREILENALDEVASAQHGHGSRIDVTYDENNCEFSVSDDGRGIPIDWRAAEKMHTATMVLTQPRAGRNFDVREDVRGMNGVGGSATVHCSSTCTVQVLRDGNKFVQTFTEPSAVFPELQISEPKITKSVGGKTGTSISFRLSPQVFAHRILPTAFVRARLYEIAANHHKVAFSFNGERLRVKSSLEQTLFTRTKPIQVPVTGKNFHSVFYLVPGFTTDSGEVVHSMVNDIPAFNGGTHVDAFRRRFYRGILDALERESNRRNLKPNAADVSDGLLIYNVTTMHAPNFDSQSKTRLINEEAGAAVRAALDDEDMYKQIIKQNRNWIDQIYERCAARTQKRDTADIEKNNRRLMRTKVPKLRDANGRDRTKCILFICEGDSAVSSISAVRDPEIHGSLPLRGKIMNANGATAKELQDNAIIADIVSSVGLAFGKRADRSQLRYGQVYIAADQDPDGANITALLVNFFYLNWPELFDPKQVPFFSVFMTPFVIQQKGKARHYWYADDYEQYNSADWKNCPAPTRAKGLGSLEEEDWIHSLKNPRLIPLVDDGKMTSALDLIFHPKKADARKEWIALNAT